MKKLLISGCLFGQNVRYDGKNSLIDIEKLEILKEKYILIPFCPEVEGGLPTPRFPSEIVGGVGEDVLSGKAKLFNTQKEETTNFFLKGAYKTLELCKRENIRKALLKSKSPSCSNNYIYDGSFSKKLIKGKGVTASLLIQNGIEVFDEFEEIK